MIKKTTFLLHIEYVLRLAPQERKQKLTPGLVSIEIIYMKSTTNKSEYEKPVSRHFTKNSANYWKCF